MFVYTMQPVIQLVVSCRHRFSRCFNASFSVADPNIWNSLPPSVRASIPIIVRVTCLLTVLYRGIEIFEVKEYYYRCPFTS